MFWWGFSLFLMVLMVLMSVMFYTLLERKVLSYTQVRVGPNKIFFMGLVQPLLDGVKLMMNEKPSIFKFNKFFFYLGPFIVLLVMVFMWISLPNGFLSYVLKFSLLFLMVFLGISVYSNLFSGWSSNSKFSLIGAIRGMAQTISYELSLIFSFLCLFVFGFSLNFIKMMMMSGKFLVFLFPILLIWLINILAECGRAPFDFMEGESELVSGFNTEFSSSGFALLFVGEYGMIIFFSFMTIFMFIQKKSGLIFFSILILLFFLLMRTSYPRFRYDFLMDLAWMKMLPVSIYFLFFIFLLLLI